MHSVLIRSLNLIDRYINETEAKDSDFYESCLLLLSSLFNEASVAIYFLEDCEYCLKTALKASKKIQGYELSNSEIAEFLKTENKYKILKTKKDKFLNNNTLITKLAIRDSVFGFLVVSINDDFNNETAQSLITLSNVISYKIKDYELSEVFKLQLKAMQDAVLDKQKAYEIIKKQHKKLQEIDKTKNLFLANISHDLRTPLNAIIGFSQALDSKIFGELNEKQAEYIKDIQISGLHLLGMINEILDISKLEAHVMKYTPTELSAKQVIQEAINVLEPLYTNKDINVEFNCEFDGLIKADYQKFQQILFNLLSNAIKFTHENGKIVITSASDKKNYILKIQDNGIGIEKKNHSKIFKKFVHLDNVYTKNSTGLGLTITKELVKLHNGKITLESELNKGTTFTLEFKNLIV
ncbi:MAG: HAMP domain-containing histidine kinase [Candidatus Gastranaerophilales bacterium]|nr:HAMP domain-containing histidine kinase [Candidatus Gastranaerophilales bacterium]